MAVAKSTTIKISERALKKGVIVLGLDEYEKLRRDAVPTYYLTGKKAEELDRLVEEGLREHREGKTTKLDSLADLD